MKTFWGIGAALALFAVGSTLGQLSQSGGAGSNISAIVACDGSAQLTTSRPATTQMVAAASGKSIYVCGFLINGDRGATVKFVHGTGTDCAKGLTPLTPALTLFYGTNLAFGGGIGYVARTSAGNALCVTNSAAAATNILVAYTQF